MVSQNPGDLHSWLPTLAAFLIYFCVLFGISYSKLGNTLQPNMEARQFCDRDSEGHVRRGSAGASNAGSCRPRTRVRHSGAPQKAMYNWPMPEA